MSTNVKPSDYSGPGVCTVCGPKVSKWFSDIATGQVWCAQCCRTAAKIDAALNEVDGLRHPKLAEVIHGKFPND